jgi:hypothetical protein
MDGKKVRGTNYNMNVSAVAWCSIPEDRDDIAVWLGKAMEVMVEILPEIGCKEPSASMEEAEDFETLNVPLFVANAHLNTSLWSALTTPANHEFGLLISS